MLAIFVVRSIILVPVPSRHRTVLVRYIQLPTVMISINPNKFPQTGQAKSSKLSRYHESKNVVLTTLEPLK